MLRYANKAPYVVLVFCLLLFVACKDFFKGDDERKPIARAGERFLYEEDLAPLLKNGVSAQDSALMVTNYINNWATKQLLLEKARINLPDEQMKNFDQLVDEYRADLYTRAYVDALVAQSQDTTVSQSQIQQFYTNEKENFRLREKLVQLHFVGLPPQFLNQDEIERRLKRFDAEDKQFLDSIAVQFKKIHLNDSIWVGASRLMEEIPPLNYQNQERHLKKSQFFELQDSLGVYLGRVTNVLNANDIAPLPYVAPNIKQLILNKRRLNFIRNLETELLDEASKKKEFETYATED